MLSRIVCRAIGRSGVSGRVVRYAQVMPFSGTAVHDRLMELSRKRLLEMDIDPNEIPDFRSRTEPDAVAELICHDIQREINGGGDGMEESIEEQVMCHIRNEAGIYSESDEVTKGMKEIIARHKLDKLSQEQLWELTDDDDEDKPTALSAAVKEFRTKYASYIDENDSNYLGEHDHDFNAHGNDEEYDDNMENDDMMNDVLLQSCGMTNCEDPDVVSAIKEAASEFNVDDYNEKSAKYKSCVAALRAKFKGRPGVLSDQQLRAESDIQEIYQDIIERTKLDDHEDYERVDEAVTAASKKLLSNAKGKLSAVTDKDRSKAVQFLQNLFQKQSSKASKPSKPSKHSMPSKPSKPSKGGKSQKSR